MDGPQICLSCVEFLEKIVDISGEIRLAEKI